MYIRHFLLFVGVKLSLDWKPNRYKRLKGPVISYNWYIIFSIHLEILVTFEIITFRSQSGHCWSSRRPICSSGYSLVYESRVSPLLKLYLRRRQNLCLEVKVGYYLGRILSSSVTDQESHSGRPWYTLDQIIQSLYHSRSDFPWPLCPLLPHLGVTKDREPKDQNKGGKSIRRGGMFDSRTNTRLVVYLFPTLDFIRLGVTRWRDREFCDLIVYSFRKSLVEEVYRPKCLSFIVCSFFSL